MHLDRRKGFSLHAVSLFCKCSSCCSLSSSEGLLLFSKATHSSQRSFLGRKKRQVVLFSKYSAVFVFGCHFFDPLIFAFLLIESVHFVDAQTGIKILFCSFFSAVVTVNMGEAFNVSFHHVNNFL